MKAHFKILTVAIMLILLTILMIAPSKNNKNDGSLTYSYEEFDSLCNVDSIPRRLSSWQSNDYYSDEEERLKTIYYYSKGDSIAYTVESLDDGFFDVKISKLW